MSDLGTSDRAPGLVVGKSARIDPSAVLGANVVVHSGVTVGAACTVQDGAILGKSPALAAWSSAPRKPAEPLLIEPGAVVCAGAVVFAGARIGAKAIVGDQAHVRERATIGPKTVIGRGSAVGNDATIGARVRVQTNVWLTAYTVVEDDVFIGPGVVTTNSDSMARGGPHDGLRGPRLRRACRVGGGVVIVPGVEIGEEAFVAAGAVVTRDVQPRAFVMGMPARAVREVPPDELLS